MTELLEKAIAQVSQLSSNEQDALAGLMIREMGSEGQWSEAFQNSQETLGKLAQEALAEHARGETAPMTDDECS